MNTINRFIFIVCDNLLRFLIYSSATIIVVLLVIGNRDVVKQTIADSGAYEKFVPSVLDANKDQDSASSIPLDDPEVTRIINESFPPENLQTQTEAIVDSIFNWLDKKSDRVQFSVDFTANKNALGDKLSEYAFNRVAFLEICQTQPETFDPFTTNCRPYGYDIFEGQQIFADQIKSSEGFLGKTVLTEKELPKNKAGQNLFEQYSYAPNIFKWLKRAPLILGIATVFVCVFYVLNAPHRRKGVSRLGRTIVGNSATLIVTPFVFGVIIPQLTRDYSNELSGSSSEVLLNDIINTLVHRFDRLMILFGLWLMLIGFAVLVAERMTRPKTRYASVEKNAGLTSGIEKKKSNSPRGKLTTMTVPLQSSEVSATKKPKKIGKNSRYRKIPL